jgi:hypothetical protein
MKLLKERGGLGECLNLRFSEGRPKLYTVECGKALVLFDVKQRDAENRDDENGGGKQEKREAEASMV